MFVYITWLWRHFLPIPHGYLLEAIWQAKSSSFGRSNLPVTHQEGSSTRHFKTGDTTPDCPATMPCGPGSPPPIPPYSPQPTTAPATSCGDSPWPSPHKPSRASRGTPSPAADWRLLHDIAPQRRQPSGPVAPHPAGFSRYTPSCRPHCTTTLDVNKYCYICVILRLYLWTILQHPTEHLRAMETYLTKLHDLESDGIYGWNGIMED